MKKFLDETIRTYNRIAVRYSAAHFHSSFWMRELLEFRKKIGGTEVLEIGCGAGRDASVFVQWGYRYIGIDASQGMLRVARGRVPRGKFKLMSFYELKLPRHSFDGFWAAATLLHIPKYRVRKVLRSLRRLLRPGGIGFISVKKRTGIDHGWITEDKGVKRYFSFYAPHELESLLTRAGYEVIGFHKKIEQDSQRTCWLCYLVRAR